ncbi:hypothetical protein [Lewinella sp. LCG006]|uniref:hypothetical protein n=1 Tax=Lewinella sp. LCG006 TaxID=3231911 RepID=UPI0034609563
MSILDIFKEEVSVNDTVQLFLTTGKEPLGKILEIGEGFVLMEGEDGEKQRFFEKLIGGWNLVEKDASIVSIDDNKGSIGFNKELVLAELVKVLENTKEKKLNMVLGKNAYICKKRDGGYEVESSMYSEVLLCSSRIFSYGIKKNVDQELSEGKKVPILASFKGKKGGRAITIVAMRPQRVQSLLESFRIFIKKKHYEEATRIFFLFQGVEVFDSSFTQLFWSEYKKLKLNFICSEESSFLDESDIKKFRQQEVKVNELIQKSQYQEALRLLNQWLGQNLSTKYKSSFLLKKAQLFSTLNQPLESENVYQELVEYNEKTGASLNNISHLYFELGRLQSTDPNKLDLAIASLERAKKKNPENQFAINLLERLENKKKQEGGLNNLLDENNNKNDEEIESLVIDDYSEAQRTISELITVDLEEHRFTHPIIVSNDYSPTAARAQGILKEARDKQKSQQSDIFPLYLEAAKAYSQLNVGSYDVTEFYEAVAYYSMLKGNSLFSNFINKVRSNTIDNKRLSRLKDSACSYFIEAVNLFSPLDREKLQGILENYFKIHVLYFLVQRKYKFNIEEILGYSFSKIFDYCIKHNDEELERIAYKVLVDCGASSISTWNYLAKNHATQGLYGQFRISKRRERIFKIIQELEGVDFDISLKTGPFLKKVFEARQEKVSQLKSKFFSFSNIEFEPINFAVIKSEWNKLKQFNGILLETDREIQEEMNQVIDRIQPYLNRSEGEKTNLLFQVNKNIGSLLEDIRENTTYFGRVLYFDLLKKWQREVDQLLDKKISSALPEITIEVDPPYILKEEGNFVLPILLENTGKSTSTGFKMDIQFESTNHKSKIDYSHEDETEIAAGEQGQFLISLTPSLLTETKAVKAQFTVYAKSEGRILPERVFEFTLETEPETSLTYDDIPWKDGPIPPKDMFKGRRKLITDLAEHYLSPNRDKSYILYGLTRTGKSSILKYLADKIQGDTIRLNGEEKKIVVFQWDLSEAASQADASEFYEFLLKENLYEAFVDHCSKRGLKTPAYSFGSKVRFKDFGKILDLIKIAGYYPVFFIDEFSFMRNLIDKGTINNAFLHTIRQYTLNGQASFAFAGTYDIKQLIKDPRYGMTGQLVNTKEEQVNEILPAYAEELIRVIEDKLIFTSEAIEHIKFLSGNIPYFIQIICKYCGTYAVENQRSYIGYPELEKIIGILTGEIPESRKSEVQRLHEGCFQNNQFNPQDPPEIPALFSTIAYFNKGVKNPRGVSIAELERFWGERELSAFRPRLSAAILELLERKILTSKEEEGMATYRLSVDLFRRWWSYRYSDITLILNTLKDK